MLDRARGPWAWGIWLALLAGVCCALALSTSPAAATVSGKAVASKSKVPRYRWAVTDVTAQPNGVVTFEVHAPRRGRLDVMETAWINNEASAALLQPARGRFVFARGRSAVRHGVIHVTVYPNARGIRLLQSHNYEVEIRVWATYTPAGARAQSIGVEGVFVTP